MKFAKAADVITSLPNSSSVLLLGPPGIGKTALARAVAATMASKVNGRVIDGSEYDAAVRAELKKKPAERQTLVIAEVRDLCSHLPEDLLGLPFRDKNSLLEVVAKAANGQTVDEEAVNEYYTNYSPPKWLARLSTKVPGVNVMGVLVLDDLGAASPAVQVAAFKLVLERRSGDAVLLDDVKIISTSNRRDDKSGATTLPAALRNRNCIMSLEPDLEEWCKWAGENKLPGVVPAFLRFKAAYLSRLPADADEMGAFATPRTWELVARAFPAATEADTVLEIASGYVGQGIGTEFAAFVKLRNEIPDPKSILLDPVKNCPDPPTSKHADRLIALVTAVAETAAAMSNEKTKEAKDMPVLLLTALNHITKGGREYAGAGILTFANNGGNVAALIKTAREGRNDPRFSTLLGHLKSSLLPGHGG